MKTADYSWELTDPETINQNRLGMLTSRQRELLQRHTGLPVIGCLTYLFILALVSAPFWWPGEEPLPSFVWPLYIVIFGSGALLTIVFGLRYGYTAKVERDDVRGGKIAGGYGEVARSGRGYKATIQGRPLRTLVNKVDLLPGKYYFYYLPRSGFLLSAEATAETNMTGTAELQQHLGKRFNFNDAELYLNSTGRMSDSQRLRLLLQAVGYGIFLAVMVIVTPILTYNALTSEEFEVLSFQALCLAFMLYGTIGWLAWSFFPRVVEVVQGKTLSVAGPVQLKYSGGRSKQLYYVVQGVELPVGHKDYYTVVEGLNYRVHYTRWSKQIISIEPEIG